MTVRRWLLLGCVLIGIVGFNDAPRAQGPAVAFHGIGDLAGGRVASVVRDATRSGNVIYAVGGSVARPCDPASVTTPCFQTDTAVLWRSDNPNALQALPDLTTGVSNTTATSNLTAYDISADAAFIASQARSGPQLFARRAVRVNASLIGSGPAANIDLNTRFTPVMTPNTSALATSSDGTILYGINVNSIRGIRFDAVGATSLEIPFLGPGLDARNPVAAHGVSADGSVAVGTSLGAAGRRAYRYRHGSGVSAIPLLMAGGVNDALAVSPDGDLVLVSGPSAANPNGEAYLYRASTGTIEQRLGSPNAAMVPSFCANDNICGQALAGSMTADGSIVAMQWGGGNGNTAYFHNPRGWFHLASALLANGVDIGAAGWNAERLQLHGMSSDGTLVFGFGEHNGNVEGFVAEFAPGVLASFNPQPAPPANTSIVGVWACDGDVSAPTCAIVFTADGVYYHIEGEPGEASSGFERGYYAFDGSHVSFVTLVDTNGGVGLSGSNGTIFPVVVDGDMVTSDGEPVAARIANIPGTLSGAWTGGTPTLSDSSVLLVFTSGGHYLFAQDLSGTGSSRDSIEMGTFTWDASSGLLAPDVPPGGVDQNGDGGLFAGPGVTGTVMLTADELGFVATDSEGPFLFNRVIDPATVAVVHGGNVTATLGTAFSYQMSATNAIGFGATGLPSGLTINSGSGAISGTPLALGLFPVTVSATNAFGTPKSATLNLTVDSAVAVTIGTDVTVTPQVPPDTPPMTMTFDTVTTGGATTVAVVDAETAPPPPSGFQIGEVPLYYEISTAAVLAPNTSVTICFNYAGVDFGGQTPRLFHFVNGVWDDITSSLDAATTTLCGSTSSFSPFAIFSSPAPFVNANGFYAPLSPLPSFVNSAKAGSTVPLKFNVFVNGKEKTDTAGLTLSVTTVACTLAPEDSVDYVTDAGSDLNYTGGQFHQNWKTPKQAGCYIARITYQSQTLLSANFSLK